MITLIELLKIKNSTEVNKFFIDVDYRKVKEHLKGLVLSASLDELKQIISVFDENENFHFLEDFICDGNHPLMGEDDYWDFIG